MPNDPRDHRRQPPPVPDPKDDPSHQPPPVVRDHRGEPRLYEPALARGAEDIREAHKVQTLPIVAANNVKLK